MPDQIPKSHGKIIQSLRGMHDILPQEQKFWYFLRQKVEKMAADYSFSRIDPPILEETALFVRAVGKQTDIIEKEMFSFIDQGGENVCLRPEITASICRSYIQNGMLNLPQPVKLFYWGPVFRHDRPQAGRLRQFYQFGFEVLGEQAPAIEAQLIFLGYNFFNELGIEVSVQLNSIGCSACRQQYKTVLVEYLRRRRAKLCEDCRHRLAKNPLRVLDCKQCEEIRAEAPQIADYLCDDCKSHFEKVLEYISELPIYYELNSHLVRGLDYYTKTVFEFWPIGEGEKGQNALAAGGRYDDLMQILGGRPAPACGFAVGVERTIAKMKAISAIADQIPETEKPDFFIAQLGEPAKKKCFTLFENLRREGFKVAEALTKDSLRGQLEIANRLGAGFVLILGQKELLDETIILRDMESGAQEIIDFQKISQEMKKRLVAGVPQAGI